MTREKVDGAPGSPARESAEEPSGRELEAAARSERDVERGTASLPDEADWADAARYHACRYLITGGQLVSAAVLCGRLRDREHAQTVRSMLADSV